MDLREISDLNRIVIVDNDKRDGNAIREALQSKLIGSVFLHVDGLSGLPSSPFPNVNLVFLDLDLISTVPNSRDKASRALACLSRVIKQNSFYVLVIWSTHTTSELEDDFLDLLKTSNIIPCVPAISLSKVACKNTDGQYSVTKINRGIKKEFDKLKAQSLFIKWESIISGQVSSFANELTKGDNQRELSKKIHALAEAYAGSPYQNDISKNALFTLNEALKGSLDGAVTETDLTAYDRKVYSRVGALSNSQKSSINTHLMVDPHKKLGPGCVFKCLKCVSEHLTTATYRQEVIKVMIDLTPVCDAAQNKNILRHYIHGALVPAHAYGTIKTAGFVYTLKNQFQYDGESYFVVINLKSLEGVSKRKRPGNDEKIKMKNEAGEVIEVINEALHTDILDNVIFKFRDPIVLDLQQKTSTYMSRFGHTYLS